MPLLRLLVIAVPLVKHLLQNPSVRARLGLAPQAPAARRRFGRRSRRTR